MPLITGRSGGSLAGRGAARAKLRGRSLLGVKAGVNRKSEGETVIWGEVAKAILGCNAEYLEGHGAKEFD